jgi:hypothetical protein
MALNFSVKSWSAWSPGLTTPDDWVSWAHRSVRPICDDQIIDVKDLPMMLRRRLSPLGRMAMRVAHDVEHNPLPHLIFSSRYGETTQTLKLLHSLALNEPVSPAGFSASVHNSLAGILSISSKNTKPHTAISAGKETFCAGLLEALCQMNDTPESSALLVHYDEPLPEFYAPFRDESVEPLALALLLERNETDNAFCFSIGTSDIPVENNEDCAHSFIRFILNNENSWTWSHKSTQWSCSKQ